MSLEPYVVKKSGITIFSRKETIVDVTSCRILNCGIVLSIDRVLDSEIPSVHSPCSHIRHLLEVYWIFVLHRSSL